MYDPRKVELMSAFQKHINDVLSEEETEGFIFSVFIKGKIHNVAIYNPEKFELKETLKERKIE